jgi:hypothetical protein
VDNPKLDEVLVQVFPVENGREIGWGSNLSEKLEQRIDDIKTAINTGVRSVAQSIEGLPSAKGWQLSELSASFGIALTAEAGAILTKASAGATFEVQVTYKRDQP